ncbi:hypothetical protein ABID21_001891 [Pseudorhizobium tarimense]|uniref:Uncharacterized protein n=1 Tax=Pseudorhizobium tarimense TaxID=1079109 RepID=A0ABV2H5T6_9HYPH
MVTFFAVAGWIVLTLPVGMWVGRKLKKLRTESTARLILADGRACLSPRSSSSGGG